ncbi:MAG: response regulator transcription factor [Ardenticatenaceae bacterium]|nr:response regulator transcription factor [Ardenticatenaceae bacterium]
MKTLTPAKNGCCSCHTGDSGRCNSRQLVVTVRTVKKHVTNILGKLGVSNRTQAVARARELGLLTD